MRKSSESDAPKIDLISDYINANNTLSDAHRRLIRIMQVLSINNGIYIDEEKRYRRRPRKHQLEKIIQAD